MWLNFGMVARSMKIGFVSTTVYGNQRKYEWDPNDTRPDICRLDPKKGSEGWRSIVPIQGNDHGRRWRRVAPCTVPQVIGRSISVDFW